MAVWAATDLHGNYDLWAQIKQFLKEDDTLIYLGDAIDRGSRGFEIFMELLDDERVVYLKGNHEDTMHWSYRAAGPAGTEFFKAWKKNGGQTTLDNIKALGLDYETKMKYIDKIDELPYYAEYENDNGLRFILCHAGFAPGESFDEKFDYQKRETMIWDRSHYLVDWIQDQKYSNVIMIHGHTPILLQKQMFKGKFEDASGMSPYWYSDNHKINLDAATPSTGIAFLFNLDTLDYELFIADPDWVDTHKRKK